MKNDSYPEYMKTLRSYITFIVPTLKKNKYRVVYSNEELECNIEKIKEIVAEVQKHFLNKSIITCPVSESNNNDYLIFTDSKAYEEFVIKEKLSENAFNDLYDFIKKFVKATPDYLKYIVIIDSNIETNIISLVELVLHTLRNEGIDIKSIINSKLSLNEKSLYIYGFTKNGDIFNGQ